MSTSNHVEAGLCRAHPGQASAITVGKLLSIVVALLFVDTQGHGDNAAIISVVDVQVAVDGYGGEAEVVSNDGESGSMGGPLWVGDLVEVHGVIGAPFGFMETFV